MLTPMLKPMVCTFQLGAAAEGGSGNNGRPAGLGPRPTAALGGSGGAKGSVKSAPTAHVQLGVARSDSSPSPRPPPTLPSPTAPLSATSPPPPPNPPAAASAAAASSAALGGRSAARSGLGGAASIGRIVARHVGHDCCRSNHERRQCKWKRWPQRSFLAVVRCSRQMMQTRSVRSSSSSVASGKRSCMLCVIRRYRTKSLTRERKERQVR
mmetsp:Transcript_45055/g.105232  ORF Transcript_45055/g.105232 Transcript_45055/m.105232 type:complete len:211 (+) Transcript_45055:958-1590(+)